MEYDVEIETAVAVDLLMEAFYQGFDSVPDCEGAVGTPGNNVDYPANDDLDPCETRATGFYGAKGWLCDEHAAEAGVL